MHPTIFIRHNQLCPGDVILGLGDQLRSRSIARATKSAYSHAILVVSPHEWFEADKHGVGYTWQGWGRLKGSGVNWWVSPMRGYVSAQVFRHPALQAQKPTELEKHIRSIISEWEGYSYSDLRRLFKPLTITGAPRWWHRLAIRLGAQLKSRPNAGMFCSEVVAAVFAKLEEQGVAGASLYDIARPAELIHPGQLACSRLMPLDTLAPETAPSVVNLAHLPRDVTYTHEGLALDPRFPTINAVSRRQFDEQWKQIALHINQRRAEALRKCHLCHQMLEHKIREATQQASSLAAPKTLLRLQQLHKLFIELAPKLEANMQLETPDLAETERLADSVHQLACDVKAAEIDLLEEVQTPKTAPKTRRLIERARRQLQSIRKKFRDKREP